MDTFPLTLGCGLISTAPLVIGHFIFSQNVRFILLAWFCSFVATISLIICSLIALITQNTYILILLSVVVDNIGKLVLSKIAKRIKFLQTPTSRICLGLACGIGYGLAHVLTLFLPIVMDQPYSLDFDKYHPYWLPNSLDLAFVYHSLAVFQIALSMFFFRLWDAGFYITYPLDVGAHLLFSYMTLIPYWWLKLILMLPISYALVFLFCRSFRSIQYERIADAPIEEPNQSDVIHSSIQDETSENN